MALTIAAPNNPIHITSVGYAHPAPLTNNVPAPKTVSNPAPAPAPTPTAPSYSVAPAQVYAPALDTNAIYGRASATANSNVNPYYTKLLNDFINNQGVARQQQQQQTTTNIQNLQDQLKQIQEANAVTGTRTTEDTATKELQAAEATDQRQQDQGTAFNSARNMESGKIAQSGLTGSGLGAGQLAASQQAQDTTEARQATADQEVKSATELSKARTFEDLATSGKNAATAESKGETQANFDLNKFITGQTSDLQQYQGQTEIARRNAVAAETGKQNHILVQQFINSIANPAVRQAALSAYGGI